MKVLQLATVDNGGATWFYREALLAHSPHECRAVRTYQSWLEYQTDVLDPAPGYLAELYKWADVVHLHDEAIALVDPAWPRKPTVVTYHGSRYRQAPEAFNAIARDRGWLLTVSTLDLVAWGGEWLPTPRADLARYWQPVNEFVVCHAPTDRARKCSEMVIAAVARAQGCRLRLIEHQPYLRAIRKKAQTRLLVDGWLGYGNNAIEAWAFGMPVVSGAPEPVRAAMIAAWGALPFVLTEMEEDCLVAVLDRLRWDTLFYEQARQAGREHYEKYHRPEAVAVALGGLYERAMDTARQA